MKDEEVIEKILKHLDLWDLKVSPPAKVKAPSVTTSIDDSDSQVPFSAPSFYLAQNKRWTLQDSNHTLGGSDGCDFWYI